MTTRSSGRFDRERERLGAAGVATSQTLDKALLSLSGAAIGVSLLLLQQAPWTIAGPIGRYLLYGTWALFGATIVLTLLSLDAAGKRILAQTKMYNALDQGFLEDETPDTFRKAAEDSFRDTERFRKRTEKLNAVGLTSFGFGVVVLCVFAVHGLQEGANEMTKDPKKSEKAVSKKDAVQKGYTGEPIRPHAVGEVEQPTESPASSESQTEQNPDGPQTTDSGDSNTGTSDE